MTTALFPLEQSESGDDPRFSFGLTLDVLTVLAAHGYPDASTSTPDYLAMQQLLFRFLYRPQSTPEGRNSR